MILMPSHHPCPPWLPFPPLTCLASCRSSWPPVEMVAGLVDNDHVFCLLYKELYYRHIYAKLTPTLEQRCESWDNYCSLFGIILHGNVNMVLPVQWLWDMIDEFIYQYQSFHQYQVRVGGYQDRATSEPGPRAFLFRRPLATSCAANFLPPRAREGASVPAPRRT